MMELLIQANRGPDVSLVGEDPKEGVHQDAVDVLVKGVVKHIFNKGDMPVFVDLCEKDVLCYLGPLYSHPQRLQTCLTFSGQNQSG